MAFDTDPDYHPDDESEDSNDDLENDADYNLEGSKDSNDYVLDEDFSKAGPSKGALSDRRETHSVTINKAKLVPKSNCVRENIIFKSTKTKRKILRYQSVVFIYHCSFCYFQTPYRYNFKIHVKCCKRDNATKFWGCPQCSRTYTLKDLLDKESIPEDQVIVDKHMFYCPVCPLHEDKPKSTILERVHPSTNHLICPRCKLKISGINTLKKHLIAEHDVTLLYRCEYCEYNTSKSDSLRRHKKTHTALQKKEQIRCSHCHLEFDTIEEFKEHMKKVRWMQKRKETKMKEDGDVDGAKTDFESFALSDLDDETVNVKVLNDEDIRNIANIGKFQLRCTLCQYVNYSKTSCQRHVKNKHRPFGYSVVKFQKFYDNVFMGSIDIGKVKVRDDEQQSSLELLKVLNWTQSDEEEVSKISAFKDKADHNEVITIEMEESEDANEDYFKGTKLDKKQKKKEIVGRSGHDSTIRENNKEGINDDRKQESGLGCKDCDYKAQNNGHLLIHNQLIHGDLGTDNIYKCSQTSCKYTSTDRDNFRNHVTKHHKINVNTFYATEMKCPDCIYKAKRPRDLLIHRTFAHTDRSVKKVIRLTSVHDAVPNKSTSERGVTRPKFDVKQPLQKDLKTTRVTSKYDAIGDRSDSECDATAPEFDLEVPSQKDLKNIHEEVETAQTGLTHSWLECEYCGEKCKGMYQLAWHVYKSHSDKPEMRRLECTVCSRLDCRHRLQYKIPFVQFLKFYREKLKIEKETSDGEKDSVGIVENVDNSDLKIKKETENFCDAPGINSQFVVKVEVEDEEINVDSHGIEKSTEHKISDSLNDNLLLKMKEEFFTCSQCTFETKQESHLPLHEILAHGAPVSDIKYQCPDCQFETKYRYSLKRHLRSLHKYIINDLFTKEQAETATRYINDDNEDELINGAHSYDCQLCSLQFPDRYLRDWHVFQFHRDKTEIKKWRLRCTICTYSTYSKYNAKDHATSRHNNTKKDVMVVFDKYYNDRSKGSIQFPVKVRGMLECSKCEYIARTWDSLRHHYKRKHKMKGTKKSNISTLLLDSALSTSHVTIERVEDDELNSSDETEKGEIIRIEIDPNSDDEPDLNHDLPQNDEELEQEEKSSNKGNKRKNEELEDSTESKRCKSPVTTERDSDDDSEGLSQNEKGSKKNEILFTKSKQREKEDDDLNENDDSLHRDEEDNKEEYTKDSKPSKTHNTDIFANVSSTKKKCIHSGCNYETSDKCHLRRHCLGVHKDTREKLDLLFLELNDYECNLCQFQTITRRQMSAHMMTKHEMSKSSSGDKFICQKCKVVYRDRYQRAAHMYKAHRDKTELLQWRICCTLCSYETYLRKYAYKHGMIKHSSTTEPTVVTYKKYYRNKYRGSYVCRYKIRTLLGCDMCDFAATTWRDLNRHIKSHERPGFIPLYQIAEKKPNCMVRRQYRVKEKAVPVVEESPKTEPVPESYSKEEIMNIIGLVPKINDKHNAEKALDEPSIEHEEHAKVEEENDEVITIQVTSEDKSTKTKKDSDTGILNPFTGEFIMESGDEEPLSSVEEQVEKTTETSVDTTESFKCTRADCKYSADTLKKITDHIKSCTPNSSKKIKILTKYACHLCEEVLTNYNVLLKHSNAHAKALSNPNLVVKFSGLKNDSCTCEIEIKANLDGEKAENKKAVPKQLGKISYKCWMCGVVITTKLTLQNHTNIHAREDGNFNLKVRYSKFLDDKQQGTIILRGDRNYVPRKKKQANSPKPEYDPARPVFSCDECNFKTNKKEELKKHKNLHWSAEKEALYKAKKWYTCGVCFFHCFDVKKFNEHSVWHRTHSTTAGGIRKLGKDSWFLK